MVGVVGVVLTIGMWLNGQRFRVNFVIAQVFYPIMKRALDIEVEVEGEENMNTAPAVLMINHQSILDILIMAR